MPSRTQRRARRAAALLAAAGALLLGLPGPADAEPATTEVAYTCTWPLVGRTPTVIRAHTDVPATVPAGQWFTVTLGLEILPGAAATNGLRLAGGVAARVWNHDGALDLTTADGTLSPVFEWEAQGPLGTGGAPTVLTAPPATVRLRSEGPLTLSLPASFSAYTYVGYADGGWSFDFYPLDCTAEPGQDLSLPAPQITGGTR